MSAPYGDIGLYVTVCLQRGAKVELYFKGATLRRAPEVFQRRTSTIYHVGGHGAQGQARIQFKAITREDMCGCLLWLSFFSFSGWYSYL